MKKLLIIAAILTIGFSLQAQEFSTKPKKEKQYIFNNEFGTHAGFTTGLGFSYRRWIKKFGFQITGLPIKAESDEFYSGGLSLMYKFTQNKYVNVYGYMGSHLIYTYDELINNNGIGCGFAFGRIVAFNLQLGYALYDYNYLLPTIEAGLYWKF